MNQDKADLGMVVIVDDEQIITKPMARLLKRLFKDEGLHYKVVTSQSPSDALELIKSSNRDLAVVISDIMMEPMDGLEFLRQVQDKYPDALRIALTGYADQQAFRILKEEIELYSYQEKPWNDDEIKRIIKNALDSHRRKRLLNLYVPKEIIEAVLNRPDDEILEGREVEASILFLDIRDSTQLFHSETMDAKDALRYLNMYFKELLIEIYQHSGILDKFMGDGIMALFGVAISSDTPAEEAKNAVAAALGMREAVHRLNLLNPDTPLTIGVGISTGTVIAGNIGTEYRANYTVLGNDVNIASRLEKEAPDDDDILISERTYEYVKDFVTVGKYKPLPAKGKRHEIQVYKVIDRK